MQWAGPWQHAMGRSLAICNGQVHCTDAVEPDPWRCPNGVCQFHAEAEVKNHPLRQSSFSPKVLLYYVCCLPSSS